MYVQQLVLSNSEGNESSLQSLALCEGNSPVDSPQKGRVMRKAFPYHDSLLFLFLQCLPMSRAGAGAGTKDCGELIRQELTRFCRYTSLRGVPRTIRPGSTCLRVTWIFAVVSLLTLSVQQTFSLVNEYLLYPKVTLIYEKTVPMLGLNFTVTVCDLNPLSSQAETQQLPGELSLARLENQFYREVHNFTQCRACGRLCGNESTVTKCKVLRSQLIRIYQRAATEMGLFQDMGQEKAKDYGHQKETFIMSCQIMGLGSMDYIYKSCAGRTNIRTVTTPEYLNCFSIDVFDYSEYMPGVGVNLVLFLDNPTANLTRDYLPNRKRGRQSRGILLEVHDTKDFPTLAKDAFKAPPGHKLHAKFEMDQRERLGDPYGTCVDTEFVENYTIDGQPLKYSPQACYQSCMQLFLAKICACKQPWKLGHILDGLKHLPYCATTKDGRKKFLQRMKCVVGREESIYDICRSQCYDRCNHFMFKSSHSLSQWPTTGNFMDVYEIYLKNTIAEDILARRVNMIKGYQDHSAMKNSSDGSRRQRRHHKHSTQGRFGEDLETDLVVNGDFHRGEYQNRSCSRRGAGVKLDVRRAMRDFGAFQTLADNLIMVEALLKDDTYLVVSDAMKTRHMELISQLGGILNLWSGLNVIILFEVFEMFYRMIAKWCSSYKKRQNHDGEEEEKVESHNLGAPRIRIQNSMIDGLNQSFRNTDLHQS